MTTDTFFSLACVSVIALLFGSVLIFSGYRFFMFLLPIWGFFFGFGFGAQTIQAILGTGFLGDITSWVVGFVVALIFAVFSYLFYFFAVALIGGSFGYSLAVAIVLAIVPGFNIVAWIIGVIVGIIFAVAIIALNIQKLVIIVATSLLGASVVVGTFLMILGQLPSSELVENPVRSALQDSPFWLIIFIIMGVLGIAAQFTTSRRYEIESYNRWNEVYVIDSEV